MVWCSSDGFGIGTVYGYVGKGPWGFSFVFRPPIPV